MITYDQELHAANIAAINDKNDIQDGVRQSWRMIGFHNGKMGIKPRTDLKGQPALSYGEGYRAAKIWAEYEDAKGKPARQGRPLPLE